MKYLDATYDTEVDFSDRGIGIVHFGPGAFHRAHQAVYTHDAMVKGAGDWHIMGVSLRSTDTTDVLNRQDGVYSLAIRQGDGEIDLRLIKSIARAESASRYPAKIIDQLVSRQTRIVSMTVTEKAYGIVRHSGKVDPGHEAIAHDLKNPDTPIGVVGIITKCLDLRKAGKSLPFTVLCCDNLPQNGDLVRSGILDFARHAFGNDLANWIEEFGTFPNTMVDRITPASTSAFLEEVTQSLGVQDAAAVETEPFSQWVLEDKFVLGRPRWEAAGAIFVDDVSPYEKMKLRMLNGAHSLIAYMGYLAGKTYVRDVMADKKMSQLVSSHIAAAAKTLRPLEGIDLQIYADQLIERFENPNIAHETHQIAMDGTQKMPQRIFDPAMDALQNGHSIESFAFTTAMWIAYCKGSNHARGTYEIRDPREAELKAAYNQAANNAEEVCAAFFKIPELFPISLIEDVGWRSTTSNWLQLILKTGVDAAIDRLASHGTSDLAS